MGIHDGDLDPFLEVSDVVIPVVLWHGITNSTRRWIHGKSHGSRECCGNHVHYGYSRAF
jgi:hypothetical protein